MIFPSRYDFCLIIEPKTYRSLIFGGMFGLAGFSGYRVNAQISADNTMSTEINSFDNLTEIYGGTTRGNNLFHSFQKFSLPSDNTVRFNNSEDIGNIIGRVTGGSISEIDGLIEAQGEANLILINPAGINFGADARLNIGGSFLGSTASSVVFADGIVFSATEPNNPLLTVSVPVGLQLGQNSGAINLEGRGHNLSLETTVFSHLTRGNVAGLKVNSGKTLALVGNNLALTGGTLTAESGTIELGSVARGTVGLSGDNWNLDYSEVSQFGDIELARQSLADVSGIGSGSIALEGNRVSIQDGSVVLAQNLGDRFAGTINVNATESLSIVGTEFIGEIASGLYSETIGSVKGADIMVVTPKLTINEGASIISTTSSNASGGTINLNVAESLHLDGFSAVNPNVLSAVSVQTFGAGNAGDIKISSNSLNISDRAYISSTSFGSGKGGNVNLNVTESVSIIGTGYEQFQQTFQVNALGGSLAPGTRSAGVFIGTTKNGMAGNLQLNTDYLGLREGGIIFSPIFTEGVGGDLEINAEDVEISGSAVQISAGADSTSSAVGGNIAIDTERLLLQKGGTIINATFGEAAAGDININAAESVLLENTPENSLIFTGVYAKTITGNGDGGDIRLTTDRLKIDNALISSNTGIFFHNGLAFDRGGNGGDISIKVADTIEISGIPIDARFASGISSSTVSTGAAGNIEISTNKLLIADGSEIAATTISSGDGGDLTINAKDSIELIGTTTVNNMQRGGLLAASGREAFPQQQASGASGDITISAKNLTIEEGASIDVQSIDRGSAGNLDIQVDNLISLDDRGTISAETDFGTGGNINIQASNIFWLGNSTTTATASNNANGGNINIQANNLIALEGSRLTAEAEAGTGGNIIVDADGLFVCQTCRVGASSRLGIDGVVNIKTLNLNPDFEAADLPIQLAQPESAVALACSSQRSPNASSLTVLGRGGLPPRPSEALNSKALVDFSASQFPTKADRTTTVATQLPAPARSWYKNSQGRIILTSDPAYHKGITSPKAVRPCGLTIRQGTRTKTGAIQRRFVSPHVRASLTSNSTTAPKFTPDCHVR